MPDGWEAYDIDAIAPGLPSDDDLRLMFQVLLEERFEEGQGADTGAGR
jgi:hypothetical protein